MVALPSESRLSLDWELWVVEQLLFGTRKDDLVRVLVDQGAPPDEAARQIANVEASDGMVRLRHRIGEGRWALRLQELAQTLQGGTGLLTYETINADGLLRDHWIASRPAFLTRQMGTLEAVKNWNIDALAQRFSQATVRVNTGRTRASTAQGIEKTYSDMTFSDFAHRMQSERTDDFYIVSRNGLLHRPEFRPLWEDLKPLPDFLVPPTPPKGASLWMGPAGTLTRAHFDPHNVLLVQVQGRKRVRFAPRMQAHQHALVDDYYLNVPLEEAFGSKVQEVTLHPGEALFLPVGWFHEVQALDPSITLSFLNFRWENHFHWLGPAGLEDPRD